MSTESLQSSSTVAASSAKSTEAPQTNTALPASSALPRMVVAIALGVSIVIYTAAVITGLVPETRKIDGVNFSLILLGAAVVILLMQPDFLRRVKILKFLGVEIEREVEENRKALDSQKEFLKMILPLLLPYSEQKHLFFLADRRTDTYFGDANLRAGLRRLREMGLIDMVNNRHISELEDRMPFSLAEFVKITDDGKKWVKKIREMESTTKHTDTPT